MSIALYYSPISCSLIPFIVLTEASAEFEVRTINLRRKEHLEPDFLRLNPKHQVPVLLVDGQPVTENMAILMYIARSFPKAQLLPAGQMDEIRAIEIMAWCDSGIHPHLTPNAIPERYCDMPDSADAVRRCAHKALREKFAVAETLLRSRDWFFDHFTIPDAFFFWCFRRAKQFDVDVSEFLNCASHFERMSARSSVRRLVEFERRILSDFNATP